jgi:hypothetical protein
MSFSSKNHTEKEVQDAIKAEGEAEEKKTKKDDSDKGGGKKTEK